VSCTLPGVISGEPQWASSEFFDIEAIMPEGSPSYTPADVVEGKAVALQKMLRNLLADRFKLKVQRQTRDMAAYNLVVSKPGTWDCRLPVSCHGIRLSEDQAPNGIQADREGLTTIPTTLNLHTTIAHWTGVVALNTGRPVIDKTGLKGYYDIRLEYPEGRDRFASTIQEQLGFKLEPTTADVDVLVIEHVERPSEN
jgi:uncharacterized protein (TIGR03435 family)